jgi:hypothetical protein
MPSTIDVIVIIVLCVLMLFIFGYMGHKRKRGSGCIGCPDAPYCAKRFTEEGCKDDYKY